MKTKKITPALTLLLGFCIMSIMTFSMFRLVLSIKSTLDTVNEKYLVQTSNYR